LQSEKDRGRIVIVGRHKTIMSPRTTIILRVDERIHRRLKSRAALEGVTLNDYVINLVLRKQVSKVPAAERKKIESLSSPE
jgi:uncharacterized protein (DUF1778 family)